MNNRKHEIVTGIITGASSGIGKAIALGLSADGWQLALIARGRSGLEETAAQCERISGRRPLTLPVDVKEEAAAAYAVEHAAAAGGGIDLLINSAGVYRPGSCESSGADFDEQFTINVKGTFNMLRAVVPHMKNRRRGTIINIASRRGKIAHPEEAVYGASKFAVVGLSEALYKELSPLGIKVCALCPGWVATPMVADSAFEKSEMISTADLLETIRFLLRLSPAACIKEILIEPRTNVS